MRKAKALHHLLLIEADHIGQSLPKDTPKASILALQQLISTLSVELSGEPETYKISVIVNGKPLTNNALPSTFRFYERGDAPIKAGTEEKALRTNTDAEAALNQESARKTLYGLLELSGAEIAASKEETTSSKQKTGLLGHLDSLIGIALVLPILFTHATLPTQIGLLSIFSSIYLISRLIGLGAVTAGACTLSAPALLWVSSYEPQTISLWVSVFSIGSLALLLSSERFNFRTWQLFGMGFLVFILGLFDSSFAGIHLAGLSLVLTVNAILSPWRLSWLRLVGFIGTGLLGWIITSRFPHLLPETVSNLKGTPSISGITSFNQNLLLISLGLAVLYGLIGWFPGTHRNSLRLAIPLYFVASDVYLNLSGPSLIQPFLACQVALTISLSYLFIQSTYKGRRHGI